MKQKQFFIILGAIGFVFLLCWLAVIILVIKNLLGSTNKSIEPAVINVALCDVNASDLCVVNFGANNLNRMVINFQLPNADYAPFYVKAINRGTASVYTCEVAQAVPTSVYCTGMRTPLGETIDIEVYTTDGDKLMARGTFLVSAIELATPISVPAGTPSEEETPTLFPIPSEEVISTQSVEATPTQSEKITPTQSKSTPTPTSTPDIAYP
jgi:hypothetical protein